MVDWFEKIAPVRQKMLVAFGFLIGVMTLVALASLIAPWWVALPIDVVLITGASIQCARFRRAICDPYVNTVVRMEALAAGDLGSPIAYTDYRDCVGRMTKAMMTFRDAAVQQQQGAAEQAKVVEVLGRALQRLTDGDLTGEIQETFPGSYGALRTNFNSALSSLRRLIGSVTRSAGSISTGSGEIAQASEDLARRTEANAANLEETTTAVSQMDERLKATAIAAQETVARADGAINSVEGGRATAEKAVEAMTRVSDSAKGIDSVIEGLDKIAFQTRVLAMNAAVEAGRAGEAGRGFAVVADLVSALAMRAEEEAARARDQLTTTQSEVVEAVEMVRKVDAALLGISSDVDEVHQLLVHIAADNQAQSSAVTQISTVIGSMDEATQRNASMVEQTSAAARGLNSEVAVLTEEASRFIVDDAETPRRTGTRLRAAA